MGEHFGVFKRLKAVFAIFCYRMWHRFMTRLRGVWISCVFVGGNSNYRRKLFMYCKWNYNLISFLDIRSQLVWVLGLSGFYLITWRMISRSAGYKILFQTQPPFRRNLLSLVGVISFVSLNFYSLVIRPQLPCFIQLNKTFTQTMRGCFGFFTQLAESSLFWQWSILKFD